MSFEARPLPEMIEVGGEMVVGPFCRHCGYPLSLHGRGLRCPTKPNMILGPSCDCHEVQTVVGRSGGRRGVRRRIVRKDA